MSESSVSDWAYPDVLQWPATGWYEVGTAAALLNHDAIGAWAKKAGVDLFATYALQVEKKTVTVHQYVKKENGDWLMRETENEPELETISFGVVL